jgi:hypothetical protein
MDQKKDHLQTNIDRPDFSICLANSFLFPSSSCSFGVNDDKSLSACGVSFAPQKIFPSPFLHRHYLSGAKGLQWLHQARNQHQADIFIPTIVPEIKKTSRVTPQ